MLPLNAIFILTFRTTLSRVSNLVKPTSERRRPPITRPQIETDLEYVPNSAKTICGIRLWISLNIFRRRRSGDTGKRTRDGDDGGGDDDGSETGEIMFFYFYPLSSTPALAAKTVRCPFDPTLAFEKQKKQKTTAHKDGCRRLCAIIAAIVSGVWLMAFQGGSAIFREPAVRIFKVFFSFFDSLARFTVRSIDDYECQTTMDPETTKVKHPCRARTPLGRRLYARASVYRVTETSVKV